MDQCTHEVRAEYWKKIIQACGQRPAGQSAKSWMDENGISEQSYYHWQRHLCCTKIRKVVVIGIAVMLNNLYSFHHILAHSRFYFLGCLAGMSAYA